jgi:hypothetical protein
MKRDTPDERLGERKDACRRRREGREIVTDGVIEREKVAIRRGEAAMSSEVTIAGEARRGNAEKMVVKSMWKR